MSFQELVKNRRSVRGYKPDAVKQEDLELILEAARLAPTTANKQAFKIVVLETKGHEEALARIYHRPWFVEGPYVLGVLAETDKAWVRKDGKNHANIDGAIVMDHIVLQAAELGLGTCWICNFDDEATRQLLNLPPEIDPVAFTPLGYPADEASAKKRKSLEDLLWKVPQH